MFAQGITFKPSDKQPNNIKGVSKNILKDNSAFRKNPASGPIFQSSCDNNTGRLPADGLVSLLTRAYCEHHKIVLRPEDIWAAIQVQFSLYVNANAEALRSVFVKHEDQKQLTVYDSEVFSQDLNIMSIKMVEKMKEHLQDEKLIHWILPKFSTTTLHDVSVFAILTMGTLQKYFKYGFQLMCGLPEVTLLGTVEDWQEIRRRAEQLTKYENPIEEHDINRSNRYMAKWCELLLPVLDKFVETAQGAPDLEWWNKACHKYSGGSGPSYLTGWITVFNVFSNTGKWIAGKHSDKYRRINNSEWPLIDTENISNGFTVFTVDVNNNGDKFKASMYAGCMGAVIENSDTLIPSLDWGVVRDLSEAEVLQTAEDAAEEATQIKEAKRLAFLEKNKAKIEAGNKILASSSSQNTAGYDFMTFPYSSF